ncbi:transcription termination factor NusA, partial [Pelagibacterales bacterium]|nr:transcription termination factor NusA [Pelagibacterales bacterium]
ELLDPLPPLDFGRVAAQAAKQVITSKVREAERARQYDEFKDKIGQIVNGIVKRTEFGNIILDLGKAEGIIKRDQGIPRESLRNGDRVKAYIYEVKSETKGPQIFLSRAHPQFMSMLFTQEVPEIYDGIIEIKKVARDPGSRAKIAVSTNDGSIDPVGACVGMRGSRVQAVVNELQGEKIDIINWSENLPNLAIASLAPAEVLKVVLDEEQNKIEVVVDESHLSLAIGRRGQNVKLASELTGFEIDILTEAEESTKRQADFSEKTNMIVDAIDVDETLAQLLVSEGFTSIEEIAGTDKTEFSSIEGFDEEIVDELVNRSTQYLEKTEEENNKILSDLKVEDKFIEFWQLNSSMLVAIARNEIITLDDFAGLTTDDLIGYYEDKHDKNSRVSGMLDGFSLTRDEADQLILEARKIWLN